MEEFKNGVISEEALGEIAGGLKISKSAVKKILAGACVGVLALGAAGGAAGGGYLLYNKFKKGHGSTETEKVKANTDETCDENGYRDPNGGFKMGADGQVRPI